MPSLVQPNVESCAGVEVEGQSSKPDLQFEELVQVSQDAILIVAHDWTFRFANQACLDLLNYGPLVGENLFELFPGNYEEPFYSTYQRAMVDRIAGDFEAYYPEPLNYWFKAYARPLGERDMAIFFRDITDRKAAEIAREEVLSGTEEGIISLGAQLQVRYMNRRAAQVLVSGDDAAPPRTLTDLLPDSSLERNCQYVQNSRNPVSFQQHIAQPVNLWLDIDLRPSASGLLLFFRDITDQHRTSEALSTTQQRLHLTLTATGGVGTWELDLVQDVVYADATFAHLYGIDSARASAGVPQPEYRQRIHPEDFDKLDHELAQSIQTGELFSCEYRLVHPDSSVRWISVRGVPSYDEQRRAVRMFGVSFDITLRKQTEAALVQNEKLAAVGRLASSIAHEINNPLESVTNLIYLARHTQQADESQTYLSLAERELRRVSVIANQTLRFHKQSSRPRSVTSDDLLDSSLSIFQGRLVNSSIAVELRRRATRTILCFDGEIRQVLNNLFGNAIDAMSGTHLEGDRGRLLLRTREGHDPASGEEGITITVADTGSGMSPSTVRKAFEAFYTTKGIGGTGLGLWISAEIVARHRGRLRVRSRQREGTCGMSSGTVFRLFLPFDGVAAGASLPSRT